MFSPMFLRPSLAATSHLFISARTSRSRFPDSVTLSTKVSNTWPAAKCLGAFARLQPAVNGVVS